MSPRSPVENERLRRRSREAILRSALELFAERGYGGTTISDVATRAGVSKGLVYSHVASKDDLLRELLAERGRRAAERAAAVGRAGPPAHRLRRLLWASLVDVRDHADELRLHVALRLQPESVPAVAAGAASVLEERRRMSELMVSLLRELGSSDASGDALVAQAALDGVAVWLLMAMAAGGAVSDGWIEGMVDRVARRLGA